MSFVLRSLDRAIDSGPLWPAEFPGGLRQPRDGV